MASRTMFCRKPTVLSKACVIMIIKLPIRRLNSSGAHVDCCHGGLPLTLSFLAGSAVEIGTQLSGRTEETIFSDTGPVMSERGQKDAGDLSAQWPGRQEALHMLK